MNNTGSDPPLGSKYTVFIFLSVNNIVIADANIGNDNNNNIAVINIPHTNNGIACNVNPGALIFNIVLIKFIAPNSDDIPAKCNANIDKSTAPPECDTIDDNGGYNVHPVPGPPSIYVAITINNIAGTNNQNDILFNLGYAISTAPIIIGTK